MSASHRPMPGGNSRASSRNGLSMASLSCSTHRTAARKVPSAVALDDLSEEVLPIGSSHPNAFSSERNPLDLHFFQRALEQAAHSTTEDGDSAPLLSNLKRDGFALRPRRGRNGRTAVEGASWSSVGKFSMESNDLFVDASNSIPKPLDLVDSIVTDARHGQAEGPGLQRFYTALFELHAEEVVQRTQLISLFLHQANQLGCCALTLDSPPSFHDMAGYMSWLNTLLRLYMSNIVEENIVDYYDIYARLWASPSTTPARRHERHPVSQLRISVPGMSDLSHCASSRYYTSVLAPLHMSSPSDSRKGSGVSASSPNGSPTFSTPDGLLPWDTPAKTREQRAQEATATRSAAAELADLRFSIQAFLVEHFAFSMRLSKWNDNSKRNSLPLDMIVLPVFHSPPAASNEAGGNELSPPAKRYRVDLHHSVQMILFLMDRSADDCPIPLHAFMPFPDVFWTSFISLAKYSFSLRCLATSQDVPLLQSYLLHPEDATHARSSHHARRTLIDREMEYRNIALNLHASWLQIACNVRSFLTKPKDEALPSIQLERFAKRKTMSQSSIFCSESSSTSQASSRTHIPSDNDAEVQSVRDEVVAAPAARPHAPSIESEGTPRLVNLFNTPEFTSPTVPSLAANRDDAWKDATGASTNQLGFFPQASFSLAMDDSHYAPEGIRSPVKRIAAQMGAARVRDNTTTLMDDYAELSPQGEADGDGFSNAPRRSGSPGTDFFNFEVGDSVSTDGNLDASLRYQSMRDTISRRPSVSMQESWSSQMIRSVDNAEALFRVHPPSRIRSMKRDASPAPGTLVGSNTRQRPTAKGPASTADDKINSAFWIELLMSASALEPNTAEASTAQGTDSSAVPSFSQCTSMLDVRYTQLLRMEALQRQYTALEEFRWRSGIFFAFDYTITQDRNYEDLSAYATMLAGVAMQWQSPPLRFAWAQQKEEKLFMLHREQTEQRTIYFENMCVLFHYQEMDTALQFFVHLHEEFQRHTESLLRLKTHASRVFGGSSSFRLRETTTDDARSIGRPPLYVRTSISDTPVSVLRSRPSASAMKQDLPVTDSRRYRRGLPHSPIEHGGDGDCDTSVSFASQQRLTPTSVTADQPDKVDPSPAQHLLSEKADTAVWVPRGGTAPQPPVAAVAGTTQSGQFNGTDSSAPLELLSLGSTNTLPSTKAVDDEQTAIIAKATYILPRKLASARRQTASQEAEAVSLPTRGTSAPPRSSGLLASPLTQRLMSSKDGASRPYNACRFWGFVDEVIRARQTKSFSMGLQLLHRLAQEFLQHGRQGVAPAGWTTPMSSSSVFMEHTYSNGDSYSGFWRDEQRWGLGMYHSSVGGFTYFGEWRRDAMCGDGVLLHIMSRALQNISTSCAANSVTSRHSSKHRNSTSNINSKSVSTITCVSGTNMPGNASLGSALYFFLGTEDAVSVPDPSMHKRLSTLGTTHEGGVAQVSMSLDVAQVHLLYAYFMHGELVTSCAYFSKTLS